MRISDWSSDVCSSDLRKVVTIARRVVRAPAGEDGVVDARRQRFGDVDRGAESILLSSFDEVLDRIRRRAVDVPLHAELWPEGPAKDHIVVFADDDGAITPCELVGKTAGLPVRIQGREIIRSEEHTSELQSLMLISYAVFCLKTQTKQTYSYNR